MGKIKYLFFCILIAIFFIFISSVHSQQEPDLNYVLQNEFNISPDKIPQDKEQLEQMYLQKEWSKIISNTSYIGPIHNFFSKDKSQVIFKILLSHQYELSFSFLLIVILWSFVWFRASRLLKTTPIFKGGLSIVAGLLIAVILAQLQIFNLITNFASELILKPSNWWLRAIVLVIIIGIFIFLFVFSKILEQYINKKEKEKKESELTEKVTEVKALTSEAK